MIATGYSNSYNRGMFSAMSSGTGSTFPLFSKWQCTNPLHTGTDRHSYACSPKCLEPITSKQHWSMLLHEIIYVLLFVSCVVLFQGFLTAASFPLHIVYLVQIRYSDLGILAFVVFSSTRPSGEANQAACLSGLVYPCHKT